ncbi:MAG: hypothetical protein GF383_14680 [Candidatus Lokiarchaeota archaeon]|nr:hypothetical protein [Candidatus Lokiarchaeota archaeon]MBD3342661.1 hypothetical protein [Candidatus Lokiarchaeota archaeon]
MKKFSRDENKITSLNSWQVKKSDDYYYIRLKNINVIFGNIFLPGRSGLEWICPFKIFLHEITRLKSELGMFLVIL